MAALLPQSAAAAGPLALKSVTMTSADRHFGVAEAFRVQQTSLAKDAGVKWERITMSWPQLDPGYWNGEWYLPDSYIKSQINQDIDMVGMLIGTPTRYASDPAKGVQAVPAGLYLAYNDPNNTWGQFVRKSAQYYKGRIYHWIIWNEPDITPSDPNAAYYTWSGSVADYYQLLKVAYLSIKDVDPSLTVGTAGFTYWTDKHAGRRQYFDRLLDEVARDPSAAAHNNYMDFVSLHLYSDPHALYDVPILYHQFMTARGFDRPIWINETNVIPYDDPVNAGSPLAAPTDMRSSLGEQASFIIQAYALGLAAGVERIEVYKMKDGDDDIINGQALVGNLPNLQPRPAYVSYQLAAQYFSNARSASYFKKGDVEEVVFDRGDQRVTALWNSGTQAATVTVRASGGSAQLLDKYGLPKDLPSASGGYTVSLDPATNFTNPDAPGKALIGGNPLLLIESGAAGPVASSLS
ncbi:MAG: hypothetical protein JOZ39_12120 [Chloroflexi bacterium]|nr:hypothetical protein [Chloroflexota bacterium]